MGTKPLGIFLGTHWRMGGRGHSLERVVRNDCTRGKSKRRGFGTVAFAGAAVYATILAGTTWNILDAQTAKKNAPGQGAPAKRDASRRVPSHFGQVGLTPEQRERIYKVQAKHHENIDELQKQLDNARLEMMKECEAMKQS